ncbi:MAG: hypothetical protein CVT77_05435, partial [Alphaproteobacteria bacterium HGW-Alphaproteobacteria-16]
MKSYRVSGLTVDSDIALPSFAGIDRAATADIVVRAGAVPDQVAGAQLIGPNWVLAPGAIILGIPGVVRMMMHGGDTLTYAVEPGALSE